MNAILDYIGTLGIGALLTVIVQGVINYFMHRRKWSDEISKPVIVEKLHVLRDVMISLQNFRNELFKIQMACPKETNKYEKNIEYCKDMIEQVKPIFTDVHAKLNDWNVYYDLNTINFKYDILQHLECLLKDVEVISSYYQSVTISGEPSDKNRIIVQFGDKKDITSNIDRLHTTIFSIIEYLEEIQMIIRKDINEYCKI